MIRILIGICVISCWTASSALQLKIWNDQPPGRLLKQDPNDTPTPWRDPYDFEGPPRYENLLGRCFSNQIQQYEYKLCPFRNATQREVSTGWNAFHGILGMWDKWRVSGDLSFFAMTYSDGTACSFNVRRYIEVVFECGEAYEILSVREPETCKYLMRFSLPEVCNAATAELAAEVNTIVAKHRVAESISNDSDTESTESYVLVDDDGEVVTHTEYFRSIDNEWPDEDDFIDEVVWQESEQDVDYDLEQSRECTCPPPSPSKPCPKCAACNCEAICADQVRAEGERVRAEAGEAQQSATGLGILQQMMAQLSLAENSGTEAVERSLRGIDSQIDMLQRLKDQLKARAKGQQRASGSAAGAGGADGGASNKAETA